MARGQSSNEAPGLVFHVVEPCLLAPLPAESNLLSTTSKTRNGVIRPMCRRFYLTATPAEMKKMFKVDYVPELVPRYNIAPAQLSPIVIAVEKGRSIHMARWGLVPSWSRDLSLGA